MAKWLCFLFATALTCGCLFGGVVAGPTPQYELVDCSLSPQEREITIDNYSTLFRGSWSGGPTDTYYVQLDWGDGTAPLAYHTANYSDDFYHHYDTKGKNPGYTWTVTLRVTNYQTATDHSTVVLVE